MRVVPSKRSGCSRKFCRIRALFREMTEPHAVEGDDAGFHPGKKSGPSQAEEQEDDVR